MMQRMHRQTGAAVLLLIIALVGTVLSLSLVTHHRLHSLLQQSRLQWRIADDFWKAEAGLECAYLQLKSSGLVSHSCGLTDCDIQIVTMPNGWLVHSIVSDMTTTKAFNTADNRWLTGSWNDY